jgi:GH25 family lysozyme M1 (1,4-beta-N-acetylmuramidase)
LIFYDTGVKMNYLSSSKLYFLYGISSLLGEIVGSIKETGLFKPTVASNDPMTICQTSGIDNCTTDPTKLPILVNIDVSSYQGHIDWSNFDFDSGYLCYVLNYIWVRSSFGKTEDTEFANNMQGITNSTFSDHVGLYHALKPDDVDPCDVQANLVVSLYNRPYVANSHWAIDVEVPSDRTAWPEMADCLAKFMSVTSSQLPVPTIYTSPSQWNPNFDVSSCDLVKDSQLWASRYDENPPAPVICWEDRSWETWQFTNTVYWPSITSNSVDLSCLNPNSSRKIASAIDMNNQTGVIGGGLVRNHSIFSESKQNSNESHLINASNRALS